MIQNAKFRDNRPDEDMLGEVEIDGVGRMVRGGAEALNEPGYQGLGEHSPSARVSVQDDGYEEDTVGMAPRRRVVELLLVGPVAGEVSCG